MALNHLWRCSTLLRNMQIKTKRFIFSLMRLTKTKKSDKVYTGNGDDYIADKAIN